MNHFNALRLPGARAAARWSNLLQDLAAETRLGIPVTLYTDPRHSFSENMGAALAAGAFSQWPETLGFGAIDDPELVEQFADIARQEYLAVGIRGALHPQIDLATEPRWARAAGGFGQSAETAERLVAAYLRGFQGQRLTPASVACMTKHFPGGGPQRDGEDPHFPYGREQVYPGGGFEYHLRPFRGRHRGRHRRADALLRPAGRAGAARRHARWRKSGSGSTAPSSPRCCVTGSGTTASSAPTGA